MKKFILQTSNLKGKFAFSRTHLRLICLFILLISAVFTINKTSAQNPTTAKPLPPSPFRIGERLTYSISFDKIKNAAYAETHVVSRGKIGEKDAVELQSKIKTINFVSAAFYFLDETRTTFASAETGLPLYVRKTSNAGVLPVESISNYLIVPTTNFDWLTLIYQARNAGGIGISMQEDDKIYGVSLLSSGSEKIKTDAGEFETNISNVQSQFLTEKGLTDFRINFSADEARIPALIRFKTAKGEFRVEIVSVQMLEASVSIEAAPTPAQTPRPVATPKPVATATPYIDNQPLSSDLPFKLGETLEYQISTNGQMLGIITLQAKERKLFNNEDSLLLTAKVTGTQPRQQILYLNDSISAQVSPETLAPQQITKT